MPMRGLCEKTVPETETLILWAFVRAGFASGEDGLGSRTVYKLLQAAGSPTALWEASSSFLNTHLKPAQKACFEKIRSRGLPAAMPDVYERAGILVLPLYDSRYPALLRETYSPPLLLFVKGDPAVLAGKTLAVVGTRACTEYGRTVTDKLVGELVPAGVSIISGLAAGIDTCAHRAALHHGLPTAAVFGCGLDVVFPARNEGLARDILSAGGALVSEYPLGTPPTRFTFPQRNRIVAGLCHGTLVVEGSPKSGALITAKLALEEGRTVYTVPGNLFSPVSAGPHALIKTGAVPVTEGSEILKDQHWLLHPAPAGPCVGTLPVPPASEPDISLPEPARQVLRLIPHDPVAVDALILQSGLTAAALGEQLTLLELEGLVRALPGALVCRSALWEHGEHAG